MAVATSVMKRADVPKESTWNSESLFAGWDEWQAEFEAVMAEIPALAEFEGKISQSPDNLVKWHEAVEPLYERLFRLGTYAGMSGDVDNSDSVAQGKRGQYSGLAGKFFSTVAFAAPELQAVGDTLMQWVEGDERLSGYEHHFHNLLRQAKHTRSAEIEEVLGMVGDAFNNVYMTANILATTDLKFANAIDSHGNEHAVQQSTVTPTGIQSQDREHRRAAWENFCDGYLSLINTFASNYITSVKQSVFNARVHGYDSVLHSRLAPFNIPVEVYHNLIGTFQKNLHVWHRFWDVKARALGVDKLHPYDIWAPTTPNDPVVTYPEAIDMIAQGMAPLGTEYVNALRKGCLEDRWVDYALNENKMQGARSNRAYNSFPFMITSYNDTLMSMSVLAHEIGHSMHFYFADKYQPHQYKSSLGSSVAETASNFDQAMVRAHLLESRADDRDFQLSLIDEAIFNFHRYFFQMPNLARLEFEVYERAEHGKPLSADILNGIMRDIYAEGYGDTMADDPDRTQTTWAQFLHLYAPFYTFQYSVGISAANALSDRVLNDNGAEDYMNFLKAGGSAYTMDLFNIAGVDMSSPEPIEKAFAVLESFVDRLEELVS